MCSPVPETPKPVSANAITTQAPGLTPVPAGGLLDAAFAPNPASTSSGPPPVDIFDDAFGAPPTMLVRTIKHTNVNLYDYLFFPLIGL